MDTKKRTRAIQGMVTIHAAKGEWGMGFVCQIGATTCVITVAHCLPRLVDPQLMRGDPVTVDLTKLGDESVRAKALIRFVDPYADVAILGDSNWGCDLCDLPNGDDLEEALSDLLCRTKELKICTQMPDFEKPFPVHIFTGDGEWVTETAKLPGYLLGPWLTMSGNDKIKPGTSGAPVFNDSGEVVGILSTGLGSEGEVTPSCVVSLAGALPRWAILELDTDGETRLARLPARLRNRVALIKPVDPAVKLREYMQQPGATIEQVAERLGMDVEAVRLMLDEGE